MDLKPITPEEFDTRIAKGALRIALVGMSNAGKSYRARVLEKDRGFSWCHVDGEIQKALGFKTMQEISRWLGYPTNTSYQAREQKYLELENEYTKQAGTDTSGKNLVFDTTGSVVHLSKETLNTLKNNCLIVHIDVGGDSLSHMVETFFKKPKPVAWCGYFTQKVGEGSEEALRRCYPALLRERLNRYRALAHVTVSAQKLYDTSGNETLQIIKSHLR